MWVASTIIIMIAGGCIRHYYFDLSIVWTLYMRVYVCPPHPLYVCMSAITTNVYLSKCMYVCYYY